MAGSPSSLTSSVWSPDASPIRASQGRAVMISSIAGWISGSRPVGNSLMVWQAPVLVAAVEWLGVPVTGTHVSSNGSNDCMLVLPEIFPLRPLPPLPQ